MMKNKQEEMIKQSIKEKSLRDEISLGLRSPDRSSWAEAMSMRAEMAPNPLLRLSAPGFKALLHNQARRR